MTAVLIRDAAEVSQVGQAIVPVVVIVPPVIGEVVAMLVTVPVPAPGKPVQSINPLTGFRMSFPFGPH
jgi:hypothetical protein